MKFYMIKHKGADWWGNYSPDTEITFSDNTGCFLCRAFMRKKDAAKYIKTLKYPEFVEIMTLESKGKGK